ncbi:zinc finger protein RFP-like [Clinocottus analis]|uniref:zinc finger protein RFP-like n=1 Tax=Clinocottus analis TaxID=304258 RepID=UPI0035BF564D
MGANMVKVEEELLNILRDLTEEEFKIFKWYLKRDGVLKGSTGIPVAELGNATREETVDLMVQKYQGPGSQEVTREILKKIPRNDLVERFQSLINDGDAQEEEVKTRNPKLKWVQQFAVEVTLDPDTAHPNLILSVDGKRVHHGDVTKTLPDNPKRFSRCVNVLGEQGFSSGKSYFEVQIGNKSGWNLGIAKGSVERKRGISLEPCHGFWTISLDNEDDDQAINDSFVQLPRNHSVQTVGVFVDYEDGRVSFYDVDSAAHLHSYTDCSFTEKIFPFFSPYPNDDGRNSAPLIISSLDSPTPTYDFADGKDYKEKKAQLRSVQQFAVEVTLDPETAHPTLILWPDGKQVSCGDVYRNLPYSAKRFQKCNYILGEQSFSSGRFYFEVQVKDKTAWILGVAATESIDREESLERIEPSMGLWTVSMGNDQNESNDDQSVGIHTDTPLHKVGVFVDYEDGLVSFYDVDAAELLYSFTDCSFDEKLFPFFGPCSNDNGVNSAPLVICAVNQND